MGVPIIPAFALCALLCLVTYRFIIQPVFLTPSSKIPAAHWTAPFSSIWILYHRVKQQNTTVVHAAHEKYGTIIRIAPNEISVNCIDGGLRPIYAGGFDKGDWYARVFTNYGIPPMFAMERHTEHSRRKRMISNVYAKSTLQNSESVASISKILLHERLLPQLEAFANAEQAFEIYDIFSATTMDFVCAYSVGVQNGSDFIRDLPYAAKFTRDFKTRQLYTIWTQELPVLTAILTRLGLRSTIIDPTLDNVNTDIDRWILGMCDRAELTVNETEADPGKGQSAAEYPCVYAQLRSSMVKDASKADLSLPVEQIVRSHRLEIASEIVDHVIAGFDTSGVTLTWLTWELSRPENAGWQRRLREEIAGLDGSIDPRQIDALPVLHAALMETLRLHAAIPGNQPRVTPAGAVLGPPEHTVSGLPANVRVQAQAWSLHRNPEVFPDPDSWRPARWLDATEAQQKEMGRWFWAFGSGGRMCVGSNLAMLEMKAIVVLIWGRFATEIDHDAGMTHNGGYNAEPIGKDGKYLMLRLSKLQND